MPKGVHNNHTRAGGRKPECLCGECKICRVRKHTRAFRLRRKNQPVVIKELPDVTDDELDRRMSAYFQSHGWN